MLMSIKEKHTSPSPSHAQNGHKFISVKHSILPNHLAANPASKPVQQPHRNPYLDYFEHDNVPFPSTSPLLLQTEETQHGSQHSQNQPTASPTPRGHGSASMKRGVSAPLARISAKYSPKLPQAQAQDDVTVAEALLEVAADESHALDSAQASTSRPANAHRKNAMLAFADFVEAAIHGSKKL